jgi:hypothetical protein
MRGYSVYKVSIVPPWDHLRRGGEYAGGAKIFFPRTILLEYDATSFDAAVVWFCQHIGANSALVRHAVVCLLAAEALQRRFPTLQAVVVCSRCP